MNDQWMYLSGSGAIGSDDIVVTLPEALKRYAIPHTVDKEKEAIGILRSLSFLDVGKHEITFPLYGLLWLSVLTTLLNPMPNFSGYAYGDTGTFKTTVAMLLLSHFGDFSQANNLSNFDDTANAIEKKAFTLKDTLLVLDDYHPSSRRQDAQNKEQWRPECRSLTSGTTRHPTRSARCGTPGYFRPKRSTRHFGDGFGCSTLAARHRSRRSVFVPHMLQFSRYRGAGRPGLLLRAARGFTRGHEPFLDTMRTNRESRRFGVIWSAAVDPIRHFLVSFTTTTGPSTWSPGGLYREGYFADELKDVKSSGR